MGAEQQKAYRVEQDGAGCKECGHGALWTVVGPDDVAHSTSWEAREIAEEFADDMNAAYEAGSVAGGHV